MLSRVRISLFLGVICSLLLIIIVSSDEMDEDDKFYQETVVLKTKLGSLRGRKEVINSATSFYAFKGIRYAKPPTGERRFQVTLLIFNFQLTI